jgi:hypothetical protein
MSTKLKSPVREIPSLQCKKALKFMELPMNIATNCNRAFNRLQSKTPKY